MYGPAVLERVFVVLTKVDLFTAKVLDAKKHTIASVCKPRNIPYVLWSSERKTGRSEEGQEQLAELQKAIRQTKPYSVEAAADYLFAVDDEAARMMRLATGHKAEVSEEEVSELVQETAAREENKVPVWLLGRKEDTVWTSSRRRKK